MVTIAYKVLCADCGEMLPYLLEANSDEDNIKYKIKEDKSVWQKLQVSTTCHKWKVKPMKHWIQYDKSNT